MMTEGNNSAAEESDAQQWQQQGSAQASLQDAAFLASLRQQMVKFATLQMNDRDLAEDAVQEALVAALKKADSFAGRAALKTWVFAILKNKIIDIFRQRKRQVNVSELIEDNQPLADAFSARGFWKPQRRPKNWGDTTDAVEDSQFWVVFETCLDGLPPRQGRAFMMREFIGLETDEMCAELNVSLSNLYVTLHRARLRLRECLEDKWFDGDCPLC